MPYTEDSLVEQPAIKLFGELGWETINCWEEDFDKDSRLGRENRGDVILFNRLRSALEALNPEVSAIAIDETIAELSHDLLLPKQISLQ